MNRHRGANFQAVKIDATGRTDRTFQIQPHRAHRLTSILDQYGYEYEITPIF